MHLEGWPFQDKPAGHNKGPEVAPIEGMESVEVSTVMPSATLPPVNPMVNPLIVIVNADDGLMEAPEIVTTKAERDVAPHTAVRPKTLLAPTATVGVTDGAKKLEGYLRVMVPPEGTEVVGLKIRQIGTGDLPTTRSEEAIDRKTDDTREKMTPDETVFDIEHNPVRNLTPKEPAVAGPIVKPPIVTVTSEALMKAPDIVITTSVAEGAPHVAVRPAMLLAPRATVGIEEGTKKLLG